MKHLLKTFFVTIPRLGFSLSKKNIISQIFLTVRLWWFVVSRKTIKTLPDFKVRFVSFDQPFYLYLRYPMDIGVLREIYLDQEYTWMPISDPKVIIDLGAHYGDTALYYHTRFPHAQIIAVEPSPENFERLKLNVSSIESVVPVQVAIGNVDGTAMLSIGKSSLGYSTTVASGSGTSVAVPMRTLGSLLRDNSVAQADLVKFDIEGAEFEMFKNSHPREFAKAYIGEVHFDLGTVTKDEFEKWFEDFEITWTEIRPTRYMFTAVAKS